MVNFSLSVHRLAIKAGISVLENEISANESGDTIVHVHFNGQFLSALLSGRYFHNSNGYALFMIDLHSELIAGFISGSDKNVSISAICHSPEEENILLPVTLSFSNHLIDLPNPRYNCLSVPLSCVGAFFTRPIGASAGDYLAVMHYYLIYG